MIMEQNQSQCLELPSSSQTHAFHLQGHIIRLYQDALERAVHLELWREGLERVVGSVPSCAPQAHSCSSTFPCPKVLYPLLSGVSELSEIGSPCRSCWSTYTIQRMTFLYFKAIYLKAKGILLYFVSPGRKYFTYGSQEMFRRQTVCLVNLEHTHMGSHPQTWGLCYAAVPLWEKVFLH